jgi:hypothetical protein
MKTQQPSFWCIANIGDVNPSEHGGGFVLVDRAGVYSPELLVLEALDDEEAGRHELHTILLERLTRIKHEDGTYGLSNNKFHPDHAAWFGGLIQLQGLSETCGRSYSNLLNGFLSSCPIERAFAYRSAADYWGIANFDNYPRRLEPEKAKLLCDTMLAQIEESKTWHDGYGVNYNG